ncbi:WW domain-binding protein 2-like isoform X3 [Acropora palmata]|uniref:WW domain-binding protein 2-like isoform X3 n=1 Tax=Acropora palmata TaxID=6131 RepID=UPI003DA1A4C8
MSVNKIQCNGGRLTLHGDYVVYHQDGVEFTLEGDEIPGFLKGSKKGNIFITSQKVIFSPTTSSKYGSFSMNFHSIRNVEVKQPMFGANSVIGDVISEQDGGWQGRGTFKVTFNSGGATEFAQHFKCAVASAQRPGSHPPPPALGQPVFVNSNGYIHNNGYQPYAGYYGAPGQAFYPSPTPGTYPAYPPPVGVMGQPPPYQPQVQEYLPAYPGHSAPSAPPPTEGHASYTYGSGSMEREAYNTGQNVYVPAPQPPPPYAPPVYSNHKKNV